MRYITYIFFFIYSNILFAADINETNLLGSNLLSSFLMFGFFILLMYFLVIRPQVIKSKEHKQLVSNLIIGDEVITNSGILGKIDKIEDQYVVLLIYTNVKLTIQKQSILFAIPKGTLKL